MVEPAVRQLDSRHELRPAPAQWMGRASGGFAAGGRHPARNSAAPLGRGHVSPALVRQFHRNRQPPGQRPRTTARTASSRRSTRVCRTAAVTRSTTCGTSVPTKFGQSDELVVARGGFREPHQLLARRGHQHQRPHAEQPDVSRRHEHRPCGDRHVRCHSEARFAQPAFLPDGRAVRHAVQRADGVHHPEGGCPGELDDPEPAGRESGGEPGRAECHGRANTGAAVGRQRQPA